MVVATFNYFELLDVHEGQKVKKKKKPKTKKKKVYPFEDAFHSLVFPAHDTFDGWRKVFFTTNEHGANTTLLKMTTNRLRGNTLIGVSGLFNLDLLAACLEQESKLPDGKLRHLIILDVNESVIQFWKRILEDLTACVTRSEFYMKLIRTIGNYSAMNATASAYGFLSSNETYDRVRNFCLQPAIEVEGGIMVPTVTVLRFDFSVPTAISTLSQTMEKCAMSTAVLYWSNVPEYIPNLAEIIVLMKSKNHLLSNSKSWVIDSDTVGPSRRHTQRLYRAKQLTIEKGWIQF